MAFAGHLRARSAVYSQPAPCTFMVESVSAFSNADHFFRCRRSREYSPLSMRYRVTFKVLLSNQRDLRRYSMALDVYSVWQGHCSAVLLGSTPLRLGPKDLQSAAVY